MTRPMFEPGDVVEVREVIAFEGDRWVPARVVGVHPHKLDCVIIRGERCGMLIALERSQQNRNWR